MFTQTFAVVPRPSFGMQFFCTQPISVAENVASAQRHSILVAEQLEVGKASTKHSSWRLLLAELFDLLFRYCTYTTFRQRQSLSQDRHKLRDRCEDKCYSDHVVNGFLAFTR